MQDAVVYVRTPKGQFFYDLAFTNLTDRWIARKHGVPVKEVRRLRSLPMVRRLRKQVQREIQRRA